MPGYERTLTTTACELPAPGWLMPSTRQSTPPGPYVRARVTWAIMRTTRTFELQASERASRVASLHFATTPASSRIEGACLANNELTRCEAMPARMR